MLSYLGERSESKRRGKKWSLQALLSLPRPPLSFLLSRVSRASTSHDIPQMESLLAGFTELRITNCDINKGLGLPVRKINSKNSINLSLILSQKSRLFRLLSVVDLQTTKITFYHFFLGGGGWGIKVELLTSLRDDHKPLGMTLQLKIIIRITYCKYSQELSPRVLVITNNNCSPRGGGGDSAYKGGTDPRRLS